MWSLNRLFSASPRRLISVIDLGLPCRRCQLNRFSQLGVAIADALEAAEGLDVNRDQLSELGAPLVSHRPGRLLGPSGRPPESSQPDSSVEALTP